MLTANSSNSIFLQAEPAYNSYEVLLSTGFFQHLSFDLSLLDMPRYNDTVPLIGLSQTAQWPVDYGSAGDLESHLTELQKNPSLWQNLSREECIGSYNSPRITKYRTLAMVTDYTPPPQSNNSALAIGTLAGYSSASMHDTLIALCPDDYLAKYKAARRPASAVYIPDNQSGRESIGFTYLPPEEADALALNQSSHPLTKRRGPNARFSGSKPWDIIPQIQLCYYFWPNVTETSVEESSVGKPSTLYYTRPRCDFLYCLAETIPKESELCRLTYSPAILLALAIVLLIKLPIFLFGLCVRIRYKAFYEWQDVLHYYDDISRSSWNPTIDDDDRPLGFLRWSKIELLVLLLIASYAWILWEVASGSMFSANWFYPGSNRYFSYTIYIIQTDAEY